MAVGTEIRFPTGDEYNLLGSGAFGVKPFFAVSRHGRFTPHANLGYQGNGRSVLYPNPNGGHFRLPNSLQYSAGADFGVVRRLTIVADLLGYHYFDAPRVTPPADTGFKLQDGTAITSINISKESYDADDFSIGFKLGLWRSLLLTGNTVIKLNDPGLRSKVVPLVGLSYRF